MDFNFSIDPQFYDAQFDESDQGMTTQEEQRSVSSTSSDDNSDACPTADPRSLACADFAAVSVDQQNQEDESRMNPMMLDGNISNVSCWDPKDLQKEAKVLPAAAAAAADVGLKHNFIPHRGSLSRVKLQQESRIIYTLSVLHPRTSPCNSGTTVDNYTLQFSSEHYIFLLRVFAVLDTESVGFLRKEELEEFVLLRCPVFFRRDWDLRTCSKHSKSHLDTDNALSEQEDVTSLESESGCDAERRRSWTFDEVWKSVVSCAVNYEHCSKETCNVIGMEGWMLFARFISLAQYYDAKRRFSARHLQTSGSEVHENQKEEMVIVEVPPLVEPPKALSIENLIQYDLSIKRNHGDYPANHKYGHGQLSHECEISLPELDLDHYYITVHDGFRKLKSRSESKDKKTCMDKTSRSLVRVRVFTPNGLHSQSNRIATNLGSSEHSIGGNSLEFVIEYIPAAAGSNPRDATIVRRSYKDLLWLHETFQSHKQLGGQLCGRILPHFPSHGENSQRDVSMNSAAVAVASASVSAGVGIVSSAAKTAKSFWDSLPGSKKLGKIVKKTGELGNQSWNGSSTNKLIPATKPFSPANNERYGKELYDTPESKARQIEKYLNYMLEHPALSSSFPLLIILKASQSGLDSAKQILSNHGITKSSKTTFVDGLNSYENIFSLRSSLLQCLPSPSNSMNQELVRTAAQAALILKVHGILETAGYQSTSTKLQHASLPRFANKDIHQELEHSILTESMDSNNDNCDEKDCISELGNESHDDCDGFDLLPDPLPLPERSALCAGSVFAGRTVSDGFDNKSYCTQANSVQGRDFYGVLQDTNLGDIDVERDIERLRELLRRVSKSFSSCCNALAGINEHRRSRELLHISILRNIDNWEGMRGQILSQRALLTGIKNLENAISYGNCSYSSFCEDMMWLASLASSAYVASKDVCSAVVAAKTASRAKVTAHLAVKNAIEEEAMLEMDDDAHVSHEKVQRYKMQELHAAVVDHEANSAKRHSVISLANDVKYWNIRRKHELLSACLKVVKEQRRAAEMSLIAWNELKSGLLDSPENFVTRNCVDHIAVNATTDGIDVENCKHDKYEAVRHLTETNPDTDPVEIDRVPYGSDSDYTSENLFLKENTHIDNPDIYSQSGAKKPVSLDEVEDRSVFNDALSSSATLSDAQSIKDPNGDHVSDGQLNASDKDHRFVETVSSGGNDEMTDSMQSLVDGLLTWGGGNWENEDDFVVAVPRGMTACLALEEDTLALQ